MFNFGSDGDGRYGMSNVRCASGFEVADGPSDASRGKFRTRYGSDAKASPFGGDPERPVEDVYAFTEIDSSPGFAVGREIAFAKKVDPATGRRRTDPTDGKLRGSNGFPIVNGHSEPSKTIESERPFPSPSTEVDEVKVDPLLGSVNFADVPEKRRLFSEDSPRPSESGGDGHVIGPARRRVGSTTSSAKRIVERKTVERKTAERTGGSRSSGKSVVNSNKNRKGRGPIVHEALQRIPPLSFGCLPRNTKRKWHAPGLEGLECGPLDPEVDDASSHSDDSIDYAYPFAYHREGFDAMDDDYSDRTEMLKNVRTEIRRRLAQVEYCNAESPMPKTAVQLLNSVKAQLQKYKSNGYRLNESCMKLLYSEGCHKSTKRKHRRNDGLMKVIECSIPGCNSSALICTRFCMSHITESPEQLLFVECTAKSGDNSRCRTPVVNISNQLPLCDIHMWERDNFNKLNQNAIKHKKSSSFSLPKHKPKHAPLISLSRRSQSESFNLVKKPITNNCNLNIPHSLIQSLTPSPADSHILSSGEVSDEVSPTFLHQDDTTELNVCSNSSICDSSEDTGIGGLSDSEFIGSDHPPHIVDPEMVAEVLGMQVEDDLDLQTNGPQQETNIDLTTVFNDFFTTEQNSEYIPTKEETEELERALEAVNQDVKSLSQHPSLLESLLDENALAETLASLPDVFNSSGDHRSASLS